MGQETMLCGGYLQQMSFERGEVWKRRWFVLTSRALVCFDNHLVSTILSVHSNE